MSKRDDNRGLELISGDAMLARKSLSTILLMAVFATSSCEDDVGDNRTPNSKYRKLSDQEMERILIGNNIKKYPIFWNHDNGISFFQGGKAVVHGYSDENASYLIKNGYFCLEMRMQNIKICSYLITNGKNVFEVSTINYTAPDAAAISPFPMHCRRQLKFLVIYKGQHEISSDLASFPFFRSQLVVSGPATSPPRSGPTAVGCAWRRSAR
jgi:hypothetical protein